MPNKPLPLNYRYVEEQIKKNLQAIFIDVPKYELLVGIPASAKNSESNETIALYAAKNEFGVIGGTDEQGKKVPSIPKRPFMRTTFEGERLLKIRKAGAKTLYEIAIQNGNTVDFLNKFGMYIAGQIKQNIKQHEWTANSPVTIKRKGSSKPLIDTTAMTQSITAWVTKK